MLLNMQKQIHSFAGLLKVLLLQEFLWSFWSVTRVLVKQYGSTLTVAFQAKYKIEMT